jgi:hypothetical protein
MGIVGPGPIGMVVPGAVGVAGFVAPACGPELVAGRSEVEAVPEHATRSIPEIR